jgi:hypothetical protein
LLLLLHGSAADQLASAPSMIKFPVYQTAAGTPGATGATAGTFTVGATASVSSTTLGNTLLLTFVGLSRIDGFPIFEITGIGSGANLLLLTSTVLLLK